MLSPEIVSISPEKSNITYWVRQKSSVEEVFTPIADKLKRERISMPRLIIFCKKCEEYAILYHFFLMYVQIIQVVLNVFVVLSPYIKLPNNKIIVGVCMHVKTFL